MLSPSLPGVDSESVLRNAAATELRPSARERRLYGAWKLVSILAALGIAAVFAVSLWARNALTAVEPVVAVQSHMFAQGEGLYYPLHQYPFTVAAYGPIFYSLCAVADRIGIPIYLAARTISMLSLLGALWFGWRILARLVPNDAAARATGLLLAAVTANLLYWGSVGQVDILAVCCSLAAFSSYLDWRAGSGKIWLAGLFVVLAVFTKQTAISSGAAIGLMLLWEDRRTAARWIPAVALVGGAIAAILQVATQGAYLDNVIFANMNPLAVYKLVDQVKYFLLTAGGLLLTVVCGLRYATRRTAPLILYTGLALAVWLLTAPKIGSDLNYQMEATLLLALAAGVGLDQMGFFGAVIANRKTAMTLLQIPIMLHIALNLTLTARNSAERALSDSAKSAEIEALRPYWGLAKRRVLGGHYDATQQLRGRFDVETMVYTMLVEAGRVDPGLVLRDIEAGRFDTVMMPFDISAREKPPWLNLEVAPLPKVHLDAIRAHYRLVKHVDGVYLNGNYIYEPIRD